MRFAYRGRDGEETRREVEPDALVNVGRRWYLVAWDRGREDWRTFRVDRIDRAAPRPACASRRARCPRQTPPRSSRSSLSAAPNRYEARVTLHAPADAVRAPVPAAGRSSRSTPRTCEYRTGDDNLEWLAVRVLMLGVDFDGARAARARRAAARLGGAAGTRAVSQVRSASHSIGSPDVGTSAPSSASTLASISRRTAPKASTCATTPP